MTIRSEWVLVLVLALSLFLAALVILSPLLVSLGAAHLFLGLVFVLLLPGLVLQWALFPCRGDLDGLARLALSVGISLGIVPLVALLLDWLPWGIRLETIITAEVGIVALGIGIVWSRQRSLPPDVCWGALLIRPEAYGARRIIGTLVVIFIAAVVLLGIVETTGPGESSTIFYLLGPDGAAAGYPRRGIVGEPITVTAGIRNEEEVSVEYRLEIADGERLLGKAGPFRLNPGAIYEGLVTFTPARAGDRLRVEFLLYRNGLPIPYRTLWLWLEVTE